MLPELPGQVLRLLQDIRKAGGQGYVVGGALRDLLMGKTPQDWDLAATLPAPVLLAVLEGARLIGGVCGTVRAVYSGVVCEVTPCRTEQGYTDKRHPDTVKFVPDILADLSRRDFTVNAMAYDGTALLDPFGGQKDIQKKLLRCVGEAKLRFEEDPLRILRLFRFAATLGFTAEWETFCAANDAMDSIDTLSTERVRDEINRTLLSDGAQVLGSLIAKGGLRKYGIAFAPSLAPLADVPAQPLCRWWALLALCGASVQEAGKAFGFSRRFIAEMEECTRLYRLGPARAKVELKQKLRNTKLDYAPVAQTFAAVSPAFSGEALLFAAVRVNKEPYRLQDLAIDGDVLRYEGIKGERCGRVLDELLYAVIKDPSLNQAPVLLGLARGLGEVL